MSKRSILLLPAAVGVVAIVALVLLGYGVNWTGFREFTDPNQGYHPPKSLWDWMELLLIPAVLALAVTWLNLTEQRRQERNAQTRINEESLQKYLDKMTDLLLDNHLRDLSQKTEVREVAKARTLTTLRGLDGKRKGAVLRFLYDSQLINKSNDNCDGIIHLEDADLSGADLRSADLSGSDLMGVNLEGANLNLANLSDANLSCANLKYANLKSASVRGADLSSARLDSADLTFVLRRDDTKLDLGGASLFKATVRWVNLKGLDLSRTVLNDAILTKSQYDNSTKWPDKFDPIVAGAEKVDSEETAVS